VQELGTSTGGRSSPFGTEVEASLLIRTILFDSRIPTIGKPA
jgi:hypothetical protein